MVTRPTTYRRGFVYGDLGASAAMLTVMLVIVFGFEFMVLRKRD
jgi:ABC-type sugar transport system permease subunit